MTALTDATPFLNLGYGLTWLDPLAFFFYISHKVLIEMLGSRVCLGWRKDNKKNKLLTLLWSMQHKYRLTWRRPRSNNSSCSNVVRWNLGTGTIPISSLTRVLRHFWVPKASFLVKSSEAKWQEQDGWRSSRTPLCAFQLYKLCPLFPLSFCLSWIITKKWNVLQGNSLLVHLNLEH